MVAPVQLHTKPTIDHTQIASGDQFVVIDVSASNAVKLITSAELILYVNS